MGMYDDEPEDDLREQAPPRQALPGDPGTGFASVSAEAQDAFSNPAPLPPQGEIADPGPGDYIGTDAWAAYAVPPKKPGQ